MPQSTMIMSFPNSMAVIFLPISSTPPSGTILIESGERGGMATRGFFYVLLSEEKAPEYLRSPCLWGLRRLRPWVFLWDGVCARGFAEGAFLVLWCLTSLRSGTLPTPRLPCWVPLRCIGRAELWRAPRWADLPLFCVPPREGSRRGGVFDCCIIIY